MFRLPLGVGWLSRSVKRQQRVVVTFPDESSTESVLADMQAQPIGSSGHLPLSASEAVISLMALVQTRPRSPLDSTNELRKERTKVGDRGIFEESSGYLPKNRLRRRISSPIGLNAEPRHSQLVQNGGHSLLRRPRQGRRIERD